MRDGAVVFGATVVRTGFRGRATPAGALQGGSACAAGVSGPYEVWLPYWQRFKGGMGFHQTTTYIHDKWRGSHGCVNLLPQDARTYWSTGRIGMTVKTFGRRPGT